MLGLVTEQSGVLLKNEKRDPAMGRSIFEIFVTSPTGSARHIESVESLLVARERLKEIACTAVGDCFIFSEGNGIIELAVHPEVQELQRTMESCHVVQGRLAT